MSNRIVSICDCFSLLGCEEPFVVLDGFPTEKLTKQGNTAFNNLRELLLVTSKNISPKAKKYGIIEPTNKVGDLDAVESICRR